MKGGLLSIIRQFLKEKSVSNDQQKFCLGINQKVDGLSGVDECSHPRQFWVHISEIRYIQEKKK